MISSRKKLIACLVVIALLVPNTTLLMASEWFEGYETGSSPQKWTDGGGGKYYYGGNISYRFKRQTTFKPLVEISPPGIKAGCNGLSISGGFMHMLGLDDIKEQLQSATQGAMMGVVVGIVYSLPGIADAFDKVTKYVRLLQQLLSQSCQMTAQLTKSYIEKERAKVDDKVPGNENAVGTIFSGLHAADGLWDDTMKKGDAYLEEQIGKLGTSEAESKKAPARDAQAMCGQTCKIASKGEGSNIKTFVANNGVNGSVFAETTVSNLSTIMTNEENRRSLEFSIVFLGYYAIEEGLKNLTKDEFAKKMTEEIKTGGKAKSTPTYERGLFFSSNNLDGASIVKTLMNGAAGGKIKMPNIKLYPYYTTTTDGAGKTNEEIYGVLFGTKDTGSDASGGYEYEWKGLETEGYDYLRKVVIDGDGNVRPTIPALLPGFNRYVATLKTMYRKNAGNTAYIEGMIRVLARKNAAMLLNAVVYEMESILAQAKEGDRKEGEKSILAIKEKLKSIKDEDASILELVEMFEKEERKQSAEITGGLGSSK